MSVPKNIINSLLAHSPREVFGVVMVTVILSLSSEMVVFDAGHFHRGRDRMANVGTRKLNVEPCRMGSLIKGKKEKKKKSVFFVSCWTHLTYCAHSC